MAAYNEVFKRIEKKYRVTPAQRHAVEGAVADALAPDAFGRTLITSVYWDTPELSLISRSLEKPKYKEKVRARAYGEAAGEALVRSCVAGRVAAEDGAHLVFLELKKKFKQVVYKRRIGLSLAALFAFLGGMPYEEAVAAHPSGNPEANELAGSALNRQIARELAAVFVRHANMTPSFAIRCERTAWAPQEDLPEASPYAQLRITFDNNLRFLDLRATSSRPEPVGRSGEIPCRTAEHAAAWTSILPASMAIMELKNAGPLPVEFTRTLARHDIYPTSFSKYGTAYQMTAHAAGQAPGLDCVFGRPARGGGVGPSSANGRVASSRLRRARDLSTAALRAFGRDDVKNLPRKKGERCA